MTTNKIELSIKDALDIIGNALANENLKLSQGEHLLNIEAFKLIKKELETKKIIS